MRLCGRMSCLPHALLGSRAASPVGILTYHRVIDPLPGIAPPLHNVTPARFEEQVCGLMRRGWQFWPLAHVLKCRRDGAQPPAKTAVITFDDAFCSVYQNAWPVLRQWRIPSTIFVCTQYLDGDDPFPFDLWGCDYAGRVPPETYRCMTRSQCSEMLDSGLVELGAHTHSHQDFRGRADEFGLDLRTNIKLLERWFGANNIPFAFPYGSRRRGFASPELQSAARDAGVSCGLTTQSVLVDLASDPYCWGRFNVFSWDTSATLAAKLDGWYSWTNRLRNWRRHTEVCGPAALLEGRG